MKKFAAFLCLIAALAGCSKKENHAAGNAQKTIVFAEFLQETNSFSPVVTTEKNFRSESLLYGDEIIPYSRKENRELAGFLKAVDDFGSGAVRLVPVVKARSMSGGPVDREFYEGIKHDLLEAVRNENGVDGVYLSMHGSMGVEGLLDPEGDILESLRNMLGPEVPIGVSFDLHANNTEKRAKNATFIVGYKTNPHRDHFETGYRSGEILVRTISGQIKPVMKVDKLRLLKGGGMNVDFLSPFRGIFKRMKKMEKEDAVLCVSFFPVHIWIDSPELGYTTVAVTDGNADLAARLADELADMAWNVRGVPQPAGNTPEEAIEIARKARLGRAIGAVVFCDVADAVGTGTPGESTWILKALMEKGSGLTSYLTMRDAQAAGEVWRHEIGSEVEVSVGGKLDHLHNKPILYGGVVTVKKETQFGKTVIVKRGGIHHIIAELPIASDVPSHFTDLGLSLWKADIVVVKNLFPFRYRYLLYNRKTVNVMTPGISSIDVFSLDYTMIPRPIYPLDEIDSWRSESQ